MTTVLLSPSRPVACSSATMSSMRLSALALLSTLNLAPLSRAVRITFWRTRVVEFRSDQCKHNIRSRSFAHVLCLPPVLRSMCFPEASRASDIGFGKLSSHSPCHRSSVMVRTHRHQARIGAILQRLSAIISVTSSQIGCRAFCQSADFGLPRRYCHSSFCPRSKGM